MTDTTQDMLIKSVLVEIEQLKAQLASKEKILRLVEAELHEVQEERDDLGFRARLFEKAYEDAVAAITKLSKDMAAPPVEPWDAKAEAEYQATHGTDYWYDHANGRYQRY